MKTLQSRRPIDHVITPTLTDLTARVRRLWNSHPPQDGSVELCEQLLHLDLELEKLTLRQHFGTPTAFEKQEIADCEAQLREIETSWFHTSRSGRSRSDPALV